MNIPKSIMPCPGSAPNPAAEQAGNELRAWMRHTALVENPRHLDVLSSARPNHVAARLYPAVSPDALAVIAQWLTINFLVDDLLDTEDDRDRCAAMVTDLVGAIRSERPMVRPATANPLLVAMDDVWRRTSAGRSRGWCEVFRADLTRWLDTYAEEASDRAGGRIPPIDEYRRHRRFSSGMLVFVDLVEVGAAIDLSDEVRRLPEMNVLRANTSEHMGLINDMYSAAKELASGQIHNAVYLTMHHQNCGADEALRRVNDMATECLHAFEDAAQALCPSRRTRPDADDLDACLRGYRMLMRGAFDCYSEMRRYATSGSLEAPKGRSA